MDISRSRDFDPAALIGLYDAVGWSSYTRRPEDFGPMIRNAWLVISAWDAGELVGLVRVVGDGVTVAYIQDLLVHPAHLSLIHISEPTRRLRGSRMPSSA